MDGAANKGAQEQGGRVMIESIIRRHYYSGFCLASPRRVDGVHDWRDYPVASADRSDPSISRREISSFIFLRGSFRRPGLRLSSIGRQLFHERPEMERFARHPQTSALPRKPESSREPKIPHSQPFVHSWAPIYRTYSCKSHHHHRGPSRRHE